MSSENETLVLQQEEIEVLNSIYEGDDAFKAVSATEFQYKYGDDGANRSFVLNISWPREYPNEAPNISLDTFYNRHLLPEVKNHILEVISAEVDQYLGMSMTYSLFEFVKENLEDILKNQPENIISKISEKLESIELATDAEINATAGKSKAPKEQLTKAQKRRLWDKGGLDKEERPRGWNWIDVIRHLSQTGPKDENS